MKTHLLVIDPGTSGGFALRHVTYAMSEEVVLRPFVSANEFLDFIHGFSAFVPFAHMAVVIEAVHSSPVMSPSSAFSFGENFGLWKGILATLRIKANGVSPQQWQLPLAAQLAGLEGSKRKSALNRHAKETHPGLHVTLETCDALLLSDFCVNYIKQHGHAPGKLL